MIQKWLIFAGLSLLCWSVADAQELGLRFGDVSGGNVAIDAVFSTTEFSRIHADISFGDGVGIDALWDFVYRPIGGEAFNWYAGVGPYIFIHDPLWLGVVGELGLEYNFRQAPVNIGLDWRPALSIIDETDLHPGGFGLNVRYVFGK